MTETNRALRASLERVRFEVIPTSGVHERLAHVPPGSTVTITASPTKGLGPTLALAERLSGRDLTVVPHLAARLIRGKEELAHILERLAALRLTEVFVIAGDAPRAAGPFEGARALLEAMAHLGHDLTEIGITGYPETHALISDADTIQAMEDKAPYATSIVSQICYDPAVTGAWIEAVRARGIRLPIHLGIPGVVDASRLLRISARVGLGDSVRFLRTQGGVVARLLGGYTPDDLINGLARYVVDERYGVRGWHFFTFNEIERTEAYRRRLLARLERGQE